MTSTVEVLREHLANIPNVGDYGRAIEALARLERLVEAACEPGAGSCNCSEIQRAHGHHFGCSGKEFREALSAVLGEEG